MSVAFVIQHVKRMHLTIFKSMACRLALQNSYVLSGKRARFSDQKLLNLKCVLIFSTAVVSNIFHSKTNLARYHKYVQVFM